MNQIIITGRIIPNTEKSSRNYAYYAAQGDPANGGKQSFLHCLLSTQVEGAPKDEKTGYYPTFLIPMKAFGPTADQINQYFGENTNIEVFGVLAKDNSYVKDGVEHEGGIYIKANRIVYGFGGKPKDEVVATPSPQARTVSGTAPRGLNNPTTLKRAQTQIAAPF